jgi:hypothetical protein
MSSVICTGCGVDFLRTHRLKNHRKQFRCGGIYLSAAEKGHQAELRCQQIAAEDALRSLRSSANFGSYSPTSPEK